MSTANNFQGIGFQPEPHVQIFNNKNDNEDLENKVFELRKEIKMLRAENLKLLSKVEDLEYEVAGANSSINELETKLVEAFQNLNELCEHLSSNHNDDFPVNPPSPCPSPARSDSDIEVLGCYPASSVSELSIPENAKSRSRKRAAISAFAPEGAYQTPGVDDGERNLISASHAPESPPVLMPISTYTTNGACVTNVYELHRSESPTLESSTLILPEIVYNCDICDSENFYSSPEDLEHHKQMSHSNVNFGSSNEIPDSEQNENSITSTNRPFYEPQLGTKDKRKPFVCELCGKAFAISFGMYQHIKLIHNPIMRAASLE